MESICSIASDVGKGSKQHDFGGDDLISFFTLSSEANSNLDRPEPSNKAWDGGADGKLSKSALILMILLLKKLAKWSATSPLGTFCGRTLSLDLPHKVFVTLNKTLLDGQSAILFTKEGLFGIVY